MENNRKHKILLGVAIVLLVISLIMSFTGNLAKAGPIVILFFMSLAIAVTGFNATKGLSYTVWIFTAVAAAMFYPKYFTSIGDFKFTQLVTPLLQLIMFGMGAQMSLGDFVGVIKMPKGVVVGVTAHYIIMPLVGFTIAHIFHFPPEIAAGIILIGVVPSGLASNVMSLLARANIALAVTIGAISTLLSPFITPLLMKWLAGQYVEVNFWSMMMDIMNMIILPIIAGFVFNLFVKKETTSHQKIVQILSYFVAILLVNLVFVKANNVDFLQYLVHVLKNTLWFMVLPIIGALIMAKVLKGDKKLLEKILGLISQVGIAAIITVITASGRDNLLKVGALLIITSLLHNCTGYFLGYWIAKLLRMPERDCRTLAFECGMQNGGLASGLAIGMGKAATVGLAPAIFGPLMNITGSTLANYWRGRPPEDQVENTDAERSSSS